MMCFSGEGWKKSIMLKEEVVCVFLDLEKALNRVPRNVLGWTMRTIG